MTRIESLEKDLKQTKQTMGNAIVKLVKKVKKMEKVVKSRRVVLTDSKDEAAKNSSKQGRNLQKDESKVFETLKQGKSSGETNIIRRRLDDKDVSTCFEDVSTGFEDVSPGFTNIKSASEKVSSGGEHDELAAKRLQEELELSEAQKKRMAQIAGEDVSEADYAQRMVGLISQRRKLITEQKVKAQRDKPMTQTQQRQYMATYLKNQGGWKLAQIKKLTDEELKEKFEYLMRSMERFVPMDTEKESRKRTGVELQTESSKKLKSDTKEDVEAYMEERVDEPSSEEFPMSSIPQGPAPAKIVKWQIIKTGKRGAYQIIREDNTDVVYVNFQGLLNDLTRDDLKELYRQMMLKYGDNSVHCLTVEAAHIYMLTEVKYPLPPRVCKAMLEKKLWEIEKMRAVSTMSNRHKDWLVQEQTALGKDFSNPFMADNLPKIVWLSTHHIYVCKELASPQGYGLW
ncbi:hypothetical protein Tco_0801624 [Tanacetum coccineum]|uniref:Uncharacterized protein n=1 Tax=Tanacetum coccineum TaxID=301880 RepID=A0ABQ4ZZE2_9ASTR